MIRRIARPMLAAIFVSSGLDAVKHPSGRAKAAAPLLDKARQHLREMRILNVRLKHGDGHVGIPEAAPFDAIMLTAAATHVPQALLQQLAIGGRMILPLGINEQYLWLIERHAEGFVETKLEPVRFVPLVSGTA